MYNFSLQPRRKNYNKTMEFLDTLILLSKQVYNMH